jgi:hypothetical protein
VFQPGPDAANHWEGKIGEVIEIFRSSYAAVLLLEEGMKRHILSDPLFLEKAKISTMAVRDGGNLPLRWPVLEHTWRLCLGDWQ